MAIISKPNTFSNGATIQAAEHNSNFDTIYNDYNGNITGSNISASAAIAASKLNLASIAQTIALSSVAINFAKGSDIASATTTDIGGMSGNFADITGTTTITGLGTIQAGTWRAVRFTGILTLTHNATSLILPNGGSNITTAASDRAAFVSLGSGNWLCLWYQRADGSPLVAVTASNALSGSVIQTVSTIVTATSSGTTAIPYDDSPPLISEGTEFMTRAITPTNASNSLKITVTFFGAYSGGQDLTVALFQDATSAALAAVCEEDNIGGLAHTVSFTYYMTAGTTSSTTFRVRAGGAAGATTYINGTSAGRKFGGVACSSITIQEIKA